MLTQITQHVAILAIFMHSLLCGNAYCCATTCSANIDAVSVSHDAPLPVPTCPCHSEKQDSGTQGEKNVGKNSKHECDHQHHFCQCLQSAPSNNGTAFRVILNPGQLSLSAVFLSTSATEIPTSALNPRTSETVGGASAHGVRLHLLLEHFLI
jgi:hypothetical protein